MKKQILFLTFFVLAVFAGMNKSFGQVIPTALQPEPSVLSGVPASCPLVNPVTCLTSDALHPVPGTSYEYSVSVPTPTGTHKYGWFVTQDENIITTTGGVTTLTTSRELNDGTGPHILASGTGYNDFTTGTNTLDITWKSFTHDASQPVLVVIVVEDENGCTNNIEVFEIQPVHAFTLDLANLGIDGSVQANNYATCVSPVESAVYTAGELVMNYGTNYLFFAVTAANFTDSWMPSFQVDGISGTRTVTAIDWAYTANATSTDAADWNATTNSSGTYTSTNPVMASGGAGTAVGVGGECIVVRVEIANNQEETIVAAPITLAVDGIMKNPAGTDYTTAAYGDIHYEAGSNSGEECPWYDGYTNDRITHVLSPRPDINSTTEPDATTTTPIQQFIPKN